MSSLITLTVILEDSTVVEGIAVYDPLGATLVTDSAGQVEWTQTLASDTYSTKEFGIYPASEVTVTANLTDDYEATLIIVASTSDIPTVDQRAIKRVKTKHMEIETHDPRIVQDVDQRGQANPCFCDVDICKATPKVTGCRY